MSISESGEKVENSKTTVMGQSVDTFIASTTDPGSFDLKCFFFPGDTTQVALEAIKVAGAPVAMKALYGTSNTTSFSGIVESLVRSFPLEKPATLDVKIKVTGAKVYV
jgi:hypothetical protein